jgi:hypothetical protein
MTLQIYVSHPSLVIPIKLTPGQQIGRGLGLANHLDESLWWANQKHSATIRSYLPHSFLHCSALSPATAMCPIMRSQNHFLEPNWQKLDFLHPILLCEITDWAPLKILLHLHTKLPYSWTHVSGSQVYILSVILSLISHHMS